MTNLHAKDCKRLEFDEAIDVTGFGKYNISVLTACCLLILAMYLDIFGFSVALPAVACDMKLSTAQQGLLSAVPLIGVMISSYAWGLCADTVGRRRSLLIAMPVGAILNLAASMAPTYLTLAILKFMSACFTSSANAAAFVLVGESAPRRVRSQFMFLMASATMVVQLVICAFALPIFQLNFAVPISCLSLIYRPWRLLLQVISLPGVIGSIGVLAVYESPKFLLSQGREVEAMDVLRAMYRWNGVSNKAEFPIETVYLEEIATADDTKTVKIGFLRRMWNQTAPLFKPPLLCNSLKLYYILLCAYMTSTGYTMWVPTMINAYFDREDMSGQSFCQVASRAASSHEIVCTECNKAIQPLTLYAVMVYSGVSTLFSILLSFVVGLLGKKRSTLSVFIIAALSGILLLFVTIPLLSIGLFFVFLYVALILGNINTYLVELNPTHLRGMATCLSVVVARGFGFFSVQLIAGLLADHCTPMISGYVVLIISGLAVSTLLPPD
ncbi:putative transporter svop-1 [Ostrinia furnacalis]|uniref:putative transporter svop-1 n=1 Tax=Ostrinia furnacalis TaxID=93504 RepID=UPI0010400E31|nr:putative transporter svop-1 [Ostrinia furnacalis]